MFWALISPIRKTADPPRLSPEHPISRLFQHHGATVARHPVVSIVVSILFALAFCYPFPFLSVNSPGLPAETRHAWTSARPFSSTGIPPDIGIKQAWVQGSYMEALSPEVFKEALRVQEALSVPGAGCEAFPTAEKSRPATSPTSPTRLSDTHTQAAFFHSPLLYWNCSRSQLAADQNPMETVNRKSPLHSHANMTVLWGSVFAGKRISQGRLLAADALVITMFYRLDSNAGEVWDKKAAALISDPSNPRRYDVYPKEGAFRQSRMYEFRFQPVSLLDNLLLILSYGAMVAYSVRSFSRIPTVKSKSGLFLASVTQLTGSIMASFTIMSLAKLPVSHIPREFFPLVVLVIGTENIFRLTSSVLATPPEQSPVARISTAIGEVGFLSLVAVLTDLGLMFAIGSASAPAVTEFCTFAAIALVIDFVLHLTFFMAVLSIDVRRLELQDSIEQEDLSSTSWDNMRDFSPQRISRFAELMWSGPNSLSTRIAGSAILICFLFVLNWHFTDERSPIKLMRSFYQIIKGAQRLRTDTPAPSPMPFNIARTPQSWLKLQDQLTGMEIIRATKPGAHRVLAKVHDPLFFVVKNSNRAKSTVNFWDSINLESIRKHLRQFVLTAVFVIAGITLFLNYLLVDDLSDEEDQEPDNKKRALVRTQSLLEGHSLDIVKVVACPRGIVATVGLDRRIFVWKLKPDSRLVHRDEVLPACDEQTLWPVMSLCLDQRGEFLAIAPRVGPISVWSVKDASFIKSFPLDLHKQQPSAFFFSPRHGDGEHGPRLIIVRQNGWLTELFLRGGYLVNHRISEKINIASCHAISSPPMALRIATVCLSGMIYVTSRKNEWRTEALDIVSPPLRNNPELFDVPAVLPLPLLGMVVCSRNCTVDLIDVTAGNIVRSFQTGQFRPNSLRAFHSERTTCLHCGCPSVTSFSIAYTERDSGQFIMHTFSSIHPRTKSICLRAERDRRERKCVGFEVAGETAHWLDNVEGWETTNANIVAGVRRKDTCIDSGSENSSRDSSPAASRSSTLRRRGYKAPEKPKTEDDDEWESWTMDAHGTIATYPLGGPTSLQGYGLLVSHAGPVCKVGQKSMAVVFGNKAKILVVGNERFEDEESAVPAILHNRRRPGRLR